MARLVHRYWVNFATTGDPNGTDMVLWHAVRPDRGKDDEPLMQFTNQGITVAADPFQQRLDLTERSHAVKPVAP
jgi:para-nitrobenzyl esterase